MRWALKFVPLALALTGCGHQLESASGDQAGEKPVSPWTTPQMERAPDPRPAIPSVETVKGMLRSATKICGFDRTEAAEEALIELGEQAFPAYEAILADRNSELLYVWQTCRFLSLLKTERRQFIPIALRRLKEPDALVSPELVLRETRSNSYSLLEWRKSISCFELAIVIHRYAAELRADSRRSAIRLLSAIGDVREAGAILPFLSDDEAYTRYTAADALARIGSKRELDAFNMCLKGGDPRRDANEMKYLKERRDELESRLKKNPLPGHPIN